MIELKSNQICCLIITYNPDNIVFGLIELIKNQVDKIIIVDNNSELLIQNQLRHVADEENIHLVQNRENLGIAKALNQGVIHAKDLKYEWVITFDQDSTPYKNIIEIISEVYFLYPEKQNIGAIGVNFPDVDSGSYYPVSIIKKYHTKDYLITSGCLLSVQAFFEIGGFREDFFIDNVDLEYSLRLRKNGKVSLITNQWGMNHKAGSPVIKRFAGINLIPSHHNTFRRYYMARNHIILCKDYLFKFPYFITKTSFFFVLSIFNILLFETDRKNKIFASAKGIRDGMFYSSPKNNELIHGKDK